MSSCAIRNKKVVANAESGFTLMELLVVIVILGFLVAMIAPRLSNILNGAVIDNICDSNNKGARQYIAVYYQQEAALPNHVINLVNETENGVYAVPGYSDGDAENGTEIFAETFVERNDPTLHYLSAEEAKELRRLGISQVRGLNTTSDVLETATATAHHDLALFDGATPYKTYQVATGLGVAMVGAGSADETTDIALINSSTWDETNYAMTNDHYPVGNPDWIGRIMFGLGEHSSLVTGGYVQNSALCPGGMQLAAHMKFNNYVMIVPRLAATVARMNDAAQNTGDFAISIYSIDDDDAVKKGTAESQAETIILEGQEGWDFDAACPEGHKWPDNAYYAWSGINS